MLRFRNLPGGMILFLLPILASAEAQQTGAPPDSTLIPYGEGARHGHLWIRTLPDGLYIAGKLEGGPPQLPHTRDEILSKDHVEVWLAASPDVELPEIGYLRGILFFHLEGS